MHKWNIDIILKGSGVILPCLYEGKEDNSVDVMNKLFFGKQLTDLIGLQGNNGHSHTFITAGEIASIEIYEKKG